jgi:hypothetical protein
MCGVSICNCARGQCLRLPSLHISLLKMSEADLLDGVLGELSSLPATTNPYQFLRMRIVDSATANLRTHHYVRPVLYVVAVVYGLCVSRRAHGLLPIAAGYPSPSSPPSSCAFAEKHSGFIDERIFPMATFTGARPRLASGAR